MPPSLKIRHPLEVQAYRQSRTSSGNVSYNQYMIVPKIIPPDISPACDLFTPNAKACCDN
eukprot:1122215-Amphidinium_carterae.1